MDFREFLDELYQMLCRTTGDEHTFWAVDKVEAEDGSITWNIYAANAEQEQMLLATFYYEVDVDFTASIHGALPDLVRRTHEALDEADRLDLQRDEQEIRIAGLEVLRDEDQKYLAGIQSENDDLRAQISDLEDQVTQLNWELSKERGE